MTVHNHGDRKYPTLWSDRVRSAWWMVCVFTVVFTAVRISAASRGYFTTPGELRAIRDKVNLNVEPYKSAHDALAGFAGSAQTWPHGTLDGSVNCTTPEDPVHITNGSGGGPLVLAKSYMYHLTGDSAYAADCRLRILDLVDTRDWGGEQYSGANQCILNLSWFIPRFIQAADLLEEYPGWTPADKSTFQQWLATEVYKKTSWNSTARNNNWGAAGSCASSMIADYLVGSSIQQLVDHDGTIRTLAEAWEYHNAQQFHRMNGTLEMDSRCPIWGIQDHGGIPDELRRGSSGCTATYLLDTDASYIYTQTHIQSLVSHAELLLRRGSTAMFENVLPDGAGSIEQAILFVIANPTQSWPFSRHHKVTLEVAYRYYRNTDMCSQLSCDLLSSRHIAVDGHRVFSFTTLTHGFAPIEEPAPPPVVSPPGGLGNALPAPPLVSRGRSAGGWQLFVAGGRNRRTRSAVPSAEQTVIYTIRGRMVSGRAPRRSTLERMRLLIAPTGKGAPW